MLIKTQDVDKIQFCLQSKECDEIYQKSLCQKIKEHQQVQFALEAIVEELEK